MHNESLSRLNTIRTEKLRQICVQEVVTDHEAHLSTASQIFFRVTEYRCNQFFSSQLGHHAFVLGLFHYRQYPHSGRIFDWRPVERSLIFPSVLPEHTIFMVNGP